MAAMHAASPLSSLSFRSSSVRGTALPACAPPAACGSPARETRQP
jgi:hypothetical protein